ncbi:MAG: MATE family efflux transporter [Clostridia bacterium]|nr:MATE family efflux transporter [Clostridia bacterium]
MANKAKVPETSEAQYTKMTETPIPRLVLSLGIPTTISMLITNIYNMADAYYVSTLGTSAGGAISVVFGLMAILQAFGFMFGHGAGSNISRMLGSRQLDRASKYASTGFFAALGCGLIILVGGLTFINPFMRLLGSTETILPYARDYGKWILIAAPAMASSCVLNNILRYEGKATLAMIGLTTGGILNICLDPLFIFNKGNVVFGMALPFGFGLGTEGAGVATAISQYISFSILLSMFLLKKTQSKLSFRLVQKDIGTIGDIIVTGLPSLARQGLNSVSTMVLNNQAKPFGDAAIAAMGYVGRTSSLIFSVGLGIGQGFQPVSGFNYGAKKYSRVKKASYFTLFFGAGFIGLISLFGFIGADTVIGWFSTEKAVIDIGSTALRIQCAFLISLPVSVVATMLFQSIGKSGKAFVLSCLQSGLLFIPLCLILPRFIGITGIQLSQPLAYFFSATVSVPMLLIFLKKLPKDGI